MGRSWKAAMVSGLPDVFTGGWVGYAGYDTVRYNYASSKIPFQAAPKDDRNLPDLHFALYNSVLVFDNVLKIVYAVVWVDVGEGGRSVGRQYADARERLASMLGRLRAENAPRIPNGR